MPSLPAARVLTVDDSPTFLETLAALLEEDGHDVLRATSGDAAIDLVAVQPVDCILLDVDMPGRSGRETCQHLKSVVEMQDIPIVMLTSMDDRQSVLEGLRAGADDYIGKSSDPDVIKARVRAQIRRRRLEQAIRQSEEKYRRIVETTQDGIWTLDVGARTTFVNPRMAEMLRAAPAKLVGTSFLDALDSDAGRALWPRLREVAPGMAEKHELELFRCDGTSFWAALSSTVIAEPDGRASGVLLLVTDLTQSRRLQAQLLVSDRMASVGILAAGVAHEINNPLAAVIGNLDLAIDDVELHQSSGAGVDLGPVLEELRDASAAADRVRAIVHDLKVFSRVEELRNTRIDVRSVLESAVRLAWNEIRHRARLVRRYEDVPSVNADASRLGQVFLNLLVNAAQAIPEGQADANEVRLTIAAVHDGVMVEVRDSGVGIPRAVQPRLFTPFFTTKPVGEGTGLGLSISHRIVTALGGTISFESRVGEGTAFRVVLPAAERAAEAPDLAPGRRTQAQSAARGRVLIVDDDTLVCAALVRVLSREHDVEAETSARGALARIAAGQRFDVILCDLMMPDLTGIDVHTELERTAPDQAERMVIMTGGAFTAAGRAFLETMSNQRIDKPIEAEALRALIRARMSGSR